MTTSPSRWLILADDLTGAADCGIAFAKAGLTSLVSWGEAAQKVDAQALSVDTGSRGLSAAAAQARQTGILAGVRRPGQALYKKIDSTIRGQPAAELAAILQSLAADGGVPLVVVAPSFPGTGRTVEGGRIFVGGTPLEKTPLWARDHSYDDASLLHILNGVGLTARTMPLGVVRASRQAIQDDLIKARAEGIAAVVCDALSDGDLANIAAGSLALHPHILWMGSGGLATHLARLTRPEASAPDNRQGNDRPILIAVGSFNEASRRQARALLDAGMAVPVIIEAGDLFAGPDAPGWRQARQTLADSLAAGRDTLLEIADDARPDLSRGLELAQKLAALLGEEARSIGGLIATGGDTACALLSAMGANAIRLIAEVEAGVPLGRTQGAITLPVITKAGGFGNDETLCRGLAAMKRLSQPAPSADRTAQS